MDKPNLADLDFFRNYKSEKGNRFLIYKYKNSKEYIAEFVCDKCGKENKISFDKKPRGKIRLVCNYCGEVYDIPLLKTKVK